MNAGIEWLVDGRGCTPGRLRDRASLLELLDRVVATMDLKVVATAVHVFGGPGGVTAMYLLAESHLTIHTFPETGVATVNLYVCKPRSAPDWRKLLVDALGATDVSIVEQPRGGA